MKGNKPSYTICYIQQSFSIIHWLSNIFLVATNSREYIWFGRSMDDIHQYSSFISFLNIYSQNDIAL